MATSPKLVQIPCNRCRTRTWHTLVATHAVGGEVDLGPGYGSEHWNDTHDLLQCNGCDTISTRRSYLSSLSGDEAEVTFFPPRASRHLPGWSRRLTYGLRSLLQEVYAALQSNSSRLALMGIRSVLDVVILEKVGDVGSFKDKLDALETAGYVGAKQKDYLFAVVDAGSAAVHRGHVPTAAELGHAMDITENLLQAVYVLERGARELREQTPPRRSAKKKRT